MKIKSLLIGSMLGTAASSLVAVSGANAADPIIYAEPEPMEYVRVCDVYGAGYYYIPGTETCFSINGYVWYQIGASSETDTWIKNTRARINLDARSETEWGTLRGFIRLQSSWGDTAGLPYSETSFVADQAYLELGGFRAGYGDSAWVVTQNSGVASYGSHTWGGMQYGYQRRHFMQYSMGFADGFHATIALEHDGEGFDGLDWHSNYMPDVVGLVGVNQGWGGAWLRAAYDDGRSGVYETSWAAQAGVQVNTAPGSSLRVIGFYNNADSDYGPMNRTEGGQPQWSILGSYQHQLTSDFSASIGAQYFNDFYVSGTDIRTGVDAWMLEASAIWTPVQNFEVRAEYTYFDEDGFDGVHSGFLRFQRSF